MDKFCGVFKGNPDYEDHISDDEDDIKNKNKNIALWKVSVILK